MFPAVADVLIDAASVLGGDSTLKILYMKLFEVCSYLFDAVKILVNLVTFCRKNIFLEYND